MSQSVIIFHPHPLSLRRFAESAGHAEYAEFRPPGGLPALQVQTASGGYFAVSPTSREKDFLAEFASNEDLEPDFRDAVVSLHVLCIDFNDLPLVRTAITHFLYSGDVNARDVWLDTDYGWVIRGDRFLAALALDAAWDWRQDPP